MTQEQVIDQIRIWALYYDQNVCVNREERDDEEQRRKNIVEWIRDNCADI